MSRRRQLSSFPSAALEDPREAQLKLSPASGITAVGIASVAATKMGASNLTARGEGQCECDTTIARGATGP